MQLITFISAAAATIATVSADRNAVTLNKGCDTSRPYARIINRCDYPVNIWSVLKGTGCPTDQMVTLKKGEIYSENYITAKESGDGRGVSIKISKTDQCKGNDITQLEYFLDNRDSTPEKFQLNYLDVSYVDCASDCPTKNEGYYLSAGSSTARAARATSDNSWCPILSCSDPVSCAKMSYILPDDVQTKTCDLDSSIDFYMCGSQPPSAGDDTPASSAPASSSKKAESSAPKASSTVKASSSADKASSSADYKVNVAAVTPAAQVKDTVKTPKVKTKVVYVTAYEYVNAKRHEHAHVHARRHQPFHA